MPDGEADAPSSHAAPGPRAAAPDAPAPENTRSDASKGPDAQKGAAKSVVIKKYANRRLYDTSTSTYVTLDHLADMVRRGVDFAVFDARTNDDITRQVLTQIIFEEETRGRNILPVQFLRQLIQLYGGNMQAVAPSYLEASLDAFVRGGDRLREQWVDAIAAGATGGPPGAALFEEQVRSNMALFDRALQMFNPYAYRAPETEPTTPEPASTPAAAPDAMGELARRMEEMQRQIAELAARR